MSYALVSVLHPGGSGHTSVDTVDTEPNLEAMVQHVTGRLTVPGASAAAEVKVVMDFGSGITAMSEELVEALRRQPEMMQTVLTQAFVGQSHALWGQECEIVTQSCPLHLTIENSVGTSPVYDAVHRSPWGRRCGYYQTEDLEGETWDRCHGPAQGIDAKGTRT